MRLGTKVEKILLDFNLTILKTPQTPTFLSRAMGIESSWIDINTFPQYHIFELARHTQEQRNGRSFYPLLAFDTTQRQKGSQVWKWNWTRAH